jgi:hypothetical protein
MPDIHREMMHAALDLLHEAQRRIKLLEAELKAAKDEIRRYLRAEMEE